jgi:hypothetical protein
LGGAARAAFYILPYFLAFSAAFLSVLVRGQSAIAVSPLPLGGAAGGCVLVLVLYCPVYKGFCLQKKNKKNKSNCGKPARCKPKGFLALNL